MTKRNPVDPAALTDTHSPDHWTTAGSQYARLAGDFERIDALGGVRGALARLEQHLADGCPTTHHRHITDGTCRHVVKSTPVVTQETSNGDLRYPGSGQTAQGRTELRVPCGQPLPCPTHPQAVLEGVEAEVARRAETHALGTRLTRETENAWVALGRLMATVSQIAKLAPVEKVAVERCCGGWGDRQDPTCTDAVGHTTVRQGISYAVCSRCYSRCDQHERRAKAS